MLWWPGFPHTNHPPPPPPPFPKTYLAATLALIATLTLFPHAVLGPCPLHTTTTGYTPGVAIVSIGTLVTLAACVTRETRALAARLITRFTTGANLATLAKLLGRKMKATTVWICMYNQFYTALLVYPILSLY